MSEQIAPAISLITANAKEILKHNKQLSVKRFQIHESDTGSAAVQSMSISFFYCGDSFIVLKSVATMTDQIRSYVVHHGNNKKDHSSFRGFTVR